jgi:hypothetical protein
MGFRFIPSHQLLVFVTLTLLSALRCCNIASQKEWAADRLKALAVDKSAACQRLSTNTAINSTDTKYPQVKVVVFQKDESELMSDWLQYHSHIFGIHNLHIIDNGSNDILLCKLLALFEACGAKVDTHTGSFSTKASVVSDALRKATQTFVVPLDADEFIVHYDEADKDYNYGFSRERILDQFNALPRDGRKYKFRASHPVRYPQKVCIDTMTLHRSNATYRRAAHPGFAGPAQYPAPMYKTFYLRDGFLGTDQGNHHGFAANDQGHHGSNDPVVIANFDKYFANATLSLLHFWVSSYQSMKAKMVRGQHAYHYDNATTDCTKAVTGKKYCYAGREFAAESEQSKQYYLEVCENAEDDVPINHLYEWFQQHTLSMEELVGS